MVAIPRALLEDRDVLRPIITQFVKLLLEELAGVLPLTTELDPRVSRLVPNHGLIGTDQTLQAFEETVRSLPRDSPLQIHHTHRHENSVPAISPTQTRSAAEGASNPGWLMLVHLIVTVRSSRDELAPGLRLWRTSS